MFCFRSRARTLHPYQAELMRVGTSKGHHYRHGDDARGRRLNLYSETRERFSLTQAENPLVNPPAIMHRTYGHSPDIKFTSCLNIYHRVRCRDKLTPTRQGACAVPMEKDVDIACRRCKSSVRERLVHFNVQYKLTLAEYSMIMKLEVWYWNSVKKQHDVALFGRVVALEYTLNSEGRHWNFKIEEGIQTIPGLSEISLVIYMVYWRVVWSHPEC
ncbi:hypothetical protein EVAR_3293_1 [Eumeta japonica]|uniref:Uncharacterized protein n=1 Tax=Eumeta variegata TaxID=151549 RepID=A0A4C1SVU2_EUMVA|nr:hypothetical protein EVAR_3293_1 [Eumeta japonica]